MFVQLLVYNSHLLSPILFSPVGQDIRDKFSGAVEAFSRRNPAGPGRHGENYRHRTSEDVPSSKDVVFVLTPIP